MGFFAPSMCQTGGFGAPIGANIPIGGAFALQFPGLYAQQQQQQAFPGFPPPPIAAPGYAVPQAAPPPPAQPATNGHYGIFQTSAPAQHATNGYHSAHAAPATNGDGPQEIDWNTKPKTLSGGRFLLLRHLMQMFTLFASTCKSR